MSRFDVHGYVVRFATREGDILFAGADLNAYEFRSEAVLCTSRSEAYEVMEQMMALSEEGDFNRPQVEPVREEANSRWEEKYEMYRNEY
jgi:hypothetical protein